MELRKGFTAGLLAAALVWAAPPAQSQDGDAVAMINGQPLSRKKFVETLIRARGVEILRQMEFVELARQEAKKHNARITPQDVDAEFDKSLEEIARNAGLQGAAATRENKLKALNTVLQQRGITMTEYMLAMERNAYLRKCVEADFKPDEATLREEFARLYGERVEVRHIQIGDNRKVNDVVTLVRGGQDFAAVAKEHSENRETGERGGLMEPFTFDDEKVPATLREIAFSLKPGEISHPVLTGRWFHILKLERRIPAENVRFEDVREQVAAGMRERGVLKQMNVLATRLFKERQIKVLDGELRKEYEEAMKRLEEENR